MSDPFYWVGTWHVRHADGTEEDIRLEHGNLVEDATGSCGQFLLAPRAEVTPHKPGMLPQHGMMAELNGRHFAYLKLRPGAEPRWYELNVPPQDMPTVPPAIESDLEDIAHGRLPITNQILAGKAKEDLDRKGPLADFEVDADGNVIPKSARARAVWEQEREGKWTNIDSDGVSSGEARNVRLTPNVGGARNVVTGVDGPNAKRMRDARGWASVDGSPMDAFDAAVRRDLEAGGGEAEPCG